MRWFGHLERSSVDDWVSACKNVKMAVIEGRNRRECVKYDMEVLGLRPEWAEFRDVWRDFIWANV